MPNANPSPAQDTSPKKPLPAEQAMKQTAKTDAERNEPVGPNDGPVLTNAHNETRKGDAAPGAKDTAPRKAP
jgi:hypothetical protein